jgi:hypothetical protein
MSAPAALRVAARSRSASVSDIQFFSADTTPYRSSAGSTLRAVSAIHSNSGRGRPASTNTT